jgi:hypothetical protein
MENINNYTENFLGVSPEPVLSLSKEVGLSNLSFISILAAECPLDILLLISNLTRVPVSKSSLSSIESVADRTNIQNPAI